MERGEAGEEIVRPAGGRWEVGSGKWIMWRVACGVCCEGLDGSMCMCVLFDA
jgi:hypothetical protein